MNYAELRDAIVTDAHREDYADVPGLVERFVAEAEGMIFAKLKSYGLEYTLTDTDRSAVDSPIYTLPTKVVQIRHVIPSECQPLTQVDETLIAMNRTCTDVKFYCVRPTTLILAGTPAEEAEFLLLYWGQPEALVDDTDTNTLLNDFPQLYKEAAQVPLFKRAKDFESAQIAFQSANSLIDEINRTVKKKMAGAQAANGYNVSYRSSY
jgi:hypothetical protein